MVNALIPAGQEHLPWRDVTASADFLAGIDESGRHWESRVEVIDPNGDVIASLPVDSAGVNCDGTADQRWECSLVVTDAGAFPGRVADMLHPLSGNRLRLWWMLELPGGWAELPIGVYYPSKPKISHTAKGRSFGISGRDVVSEVRRNRWGANTSLLNVGGMTHSAAIDRILADRAPNYPRRIVSVSSTLPATYEVGEPDRDPMEDVKAIADAAAMQVYADREGVIVAEPRARTSPRVTDVSARITQIDRTLDETQIVNRVTVRSSKSDVDPPVYATVQDDDPSSPTWVGLGRVWSTAIARDTITTTQQARDLATAELVARRQLVESITTSIPARPDLDPGDVLAISDPATGTAGLWELTGWSLDLSGREQMSVTVAPRRTPIR